MKDRDCPALPTEDVDAFSEIILEEFGSMADLHALKTANRFLHMGDRHNADAWLKITDRIRELQNIRHIRRGE